MFDNVFITLMAQMNKILRHGSGNNFPLPHTRRWKHKKEMKCSIKSIKVDIPEFVPTSSALPLFTFDDIDVRSDNKTNKEEESVAVTAQKTTKQSRLTLKPL